MKRCSLNLENEQNIFFSDVPKSAYSAIVKVYDDYYLESPYELRFSYHGSIVESEGEENEKEEEKEVGKEEEKEVEEEEEENEKE